MDSIYSQLFTEDLQRIIWDYGYRLCSVEGTLPGKYQMKDKNLDPQ